jgi:exonuclease III
MVVILILMSCSWNILNWNIRGLNSTNKCNAIRAKIEVCNCAIFCIQEIKKDHFDFSAIRKMDPKWFNKYVFVPSEGASEGILMAWNESVFKGNVNFSSKSAITIQFSSVHNGDIWKLMTVYGSGPDRHMFIDWLNYIQIDYHENWMFIGDFNFYGSIETDKELI